MFYYFQSFHQHIQSNVLYIIIFTYWQHGLHIMQLYMHNFNQKTIPTTTTTTTNNNNNNTTSSSSNNNNNNTTTTSSSSSNNNNNTTSSSSNNNNNNDNNNNNRLFWGNPCRFLSKGEFLMSQRPRCIGSAPWSCLAPCWMLVLGIQKSGDFSGS